MFIKTASNKRAGWTLMEMLVAVGIFAIAGAALMTIFSFSMRSMQAIANYSDLDKQNRYAMDTMTREIREAKQVTAYTTNSVSLLDGNGFTVTYTFDPTYRKMVRTSTDGSAATCLLTNCSLLTFTLFQRNPVAGSYDVYPVATNNWQLTVKGIQLTWKTSRTVPGTPIVNSENVQTARVVIRKQQDS